MNRFDRHLLPGERRLPADRRRELKARLLLQIEHEERAARRRYRLVVSAVAAVVLVLAGAIALYAGWSRDEPTETSPAGTTEPAADDDDREETRPIAPDPDEAIQATENMARFGPGAFELGPDADRVACVAPNTERVTRESSGDAQIRDVPLDRALTAEMYVQACATGDWPWHDEDPPVTAYDPAQARLCVRPGGYGPPQNPLVDDFPLPVVALDGLTCEEVGDGVTLRPATDDDVATLNRMRSIEVAVHANPDPCATLQEAGQWAEDRFAEEGIEVAAEAMDPGSTPAEACYEPGVEWQDIRYDEAGVPTGFGLNVSVQAIPDL